MPTAPQPDMSTPTMTSVPAEDLLPVFARRLEADPSIFERIPEHGSLASTAYQAVRDEVMLDGNARLNLATFVSTWMDPEAEQLYGESASKNMIDKDEYPQTAAIEERCWRSLGELWNAPDPARTIGCSTIGSSEAAMLAGLAFKRRWQHANPELVAKGVKPNLVMSSAVQVCWDKFCNYFEVEPRLVPISEEHPTLDGDGINAYIDEGTIGVVAIMGVTYTGMYEPVAQIAAALDQVQVDTGLDVPIHVDGASGAMVAPFLQPELKWDFRLDRVYSINTSGHKYGLVYPGLGWVVWKDTALLPEDLVFKVSYLGGEMPTFALNFSRPGAQVLLQYYQFIRLGMDGYRMVQAACRDVAHFLANGIAELPVFTLWNDGSDIPVLAWRLTDAANTGWTLYDLQDRLRMNGWQVPAYPLPDNLADRTVQRIVVRNGLSMDIARRLLDDIRAAVTYLEQHDIPSDERSRKIFHH